MTRTGYARSPQGVEYIVRIPETPAETAIRMTRTTHDRVIDAAIYVLTKRKVHSLMSLYARRRPYVGPCSNRTWAIYQEAQALVECCRTKRRA